MYSSTFLQNIEKALASIFKQYPEIDPIVKKINQAGATAYLVGGSVRDTVADFLGRQNQINDIDIEVHGLPLEALERLLAEFGKVSLVGKSFGIIKLSSSSVDWSLPRTDLAGRKPQVELDPNLSIKDALARRDLTMNAMAIDLTTHDLIDPFDGYQDLQKNILRSPDVRFFTQDPLRFYRVMQSIARFNANPDAALDQVCSTMDISNVSIERIQMEFEKLLLKSAKPSLGIRWLKAIGRLAQVLPELANTVGVEQDKIYHPEGDVFEHSMQALDAAAHFDYASADEKLIVLYAVLCHDLGKSEATQKVGDKITSHGHDEAGVPLAKKMLSRITRNKEMIHAAALLVKCHMQPGAFINLGANPAAYKRLALKLHGFATIEMLAQVARADALGRNPSGSEPLHESVLWIDLFLARAAQAQVMHKPIAPLLHGRDIADLVQPGKQMGELLKYAYDVQLNEGVTDKHVLKNLLQKKINSH